MTMIVPFFSAMTLYQSPFRRFLGFVIRRLLGHHAAALPAAEVALSTSSKLGRSVGGMVRRANSTQTLGEQSLAKASRADLITLMTLPSDESTASIFAARGWMKPYEPKIPRN